MSTRSRPLWPLLTAALIGLPVLYVASFGPACWMYSHKGAIPRAPLLPPIYAPLGETIAIPQGSAIASALRGYARMGMSGLVAVPTFSGEATLILPPHR